MVCLFRQGVEDSEALELQDITAILQQQWIFLFSLSPMKSNGSGYKSDYTIFLQLYSW